MAQFKFEEDIKELEGRSIPPLLLKLGRKLSGQITYHAENN